MVGIESSVTLDTFGVAILLNTRNLLVSSVSYALSTENDLFCYVLGKDSVLICKCTED